MSLSAAPDTTLLPFGSLRACPKCNIPRHRIRVRYCTAVHSPADMSVRTVSPTAQESEHQDCVCDVCGYIWLELCADARPAPPQAVSVQQPVIVGGQAVREHDVPASGGRSRGEPPGALDR